MLETIFSGAHSLLTNLLSVIYALLGFCALITIHELGHFLFARLFGIHCPTFSIGIGPTLASTKVGGTTFRIAPIPLGGYCEIAGLAEVGQGEQKFAHTVDQSSFSIKPYWQQLLVLLGGIIFNTAFAYITMIGLYSIGKPAQRHLTIASLTKDLPAQLAGLEKGDIIIALGSSNIATDPKALGPAIEKIQAIESGTVNVTVERGGEQLSVPITLPQRETGISGGRLGITFGSKPSGRFVKLPFLEAIKHGISETNDLIVQIFQGIKRLFTTRSLKGAGPVRIIFDSVVEAKSGFSHLFYLLAIISLNLAIFNLFPIPALDGGQVLFTTIEAIIGRKLPIEIKNVIFIASWVLLLSLILIFTYQDIWYLIS